MTLIPFGGNTIKSIQRGQTTVGAGSPGTATTTITSVDTTKSIVNQICVPGLVNGSYVAAEGFVYLTNGTTVTAYTYGANGSRVISWEVIEFN